MLTPFRKMHGAGNDFVVFDERPAPLGLTPTRAAAIARAWAGPSIRSFPPVDASGAAATVAALKQMVAP